MVVSSDGMTFIGHNLPCGIYVLRIRVTTDLDLAFGRFKKGKVIHIPKGYYLYIGSAMGKNGCSVNHSGQQNIDLELFKFPVAPIDRQENPIGDRTTSAYFLKRKRR